VLVQTLTPLDDRHRWHEVLGQLRSDAYHLPDYSLLEATRLQGSAEAMVISHQDCLMFVPYLVRSCYILFPTQQDIANTLDVISPYGYPGILMSDGVGGDFIVQAWEMLQEDLRSRGVCAAFFRLHPILSQELRLHLPAELLVHHGKTVSVDLQLSEAEIWAHTRKGHQSTINKTKRLGFNHRIVTANADFDAFLSVYKETMDRVSATDAYYFNEVYFEALLGLGDRLKLCLTELDGELAAACLFFESQGIVQMHLGGTKTSHMALSPFSGLIDYVRYWAKAQGHQYLHLGGGVGGSTEDSLFKFKSGFSRHQHDFHTLRCIIDPVRYQRLVDHRARDLGKSSHELIHGNFFPAYRSAA
jgi:hypothetical protein